MSIKFAREFQICEKSCRENQASKSLTLVSAQVTALFVILLWSLCLGSSAEFLKFSGEWVSWIIMVFLPIVGFSMENFCNDDKSSPF